MRIDTFEIIPVSLRFQRPFVTSGKTFTARQVLHVRLRGRDIASVGEIAPMHNFGSESLKEAYDAAVNLGKKIVNTKYLTLDAFFKLISKYSTYPAAVSGIEQAYLQLYTAKYKRLLESVLGAPLRHTIPVNAVIGQASVKESLKKARMLFGLGFRVFKLKVGGRPLREEFLILNSMRKLYGSEIKIRLDANGALSFEDAVERTKTYSRYDIEYIEQPLKNLESFAKLREHTNIPLAADESVKNTDSAIKIIERKLAQVIILKPALFGSLQSVIEIIRLAENNKIKTVITGALDSELGRRKAIVASAFLRGRIACGLTLPDILSSTDINPLYNIENGKIKIKKLLL